MYSIKTDVQITRRKFLNYVIDDDNQVRFSSKSLPACIDWLIDQGENSAWIDYRGREWATTFVYRDSLELSQDAPTVS